MTDWGQTIRGAWGEILITLGLILGIAGLAWLETGCYHVPATPVPVISPLPEAPAGFDNATNGFVDQAAMDAARDQFVQDDGDVVGPFFNARTCAGCHFNPVFGGGSQVTEHRSAGAALIHDVTTSGFSQQVATSRINAQRSSLNLEGDGFVEAVPDSQLIAIAQRNGGQFIYVPILESHNGNGLLTFRVGRFGWKDQQASLLSFSGDADCNEKGIENTLVNGIHCDNKPPSNGIEDRESNGIEDIDFYTTFMRSLKVPPRGAITPQVTRGEEVFVAIGCANCHVTTLTTNFAAIGLNAPDRQIHPYSDYLLHDVDTGDGIAQGLAPANKLRTAPLWGLRTKARFLHDNRAFRVTDAVKAHGHEAAETRDRFEDLSLADRAAILAFLGSL